MGPGLELFARFDHGMSPNPKTLNPTTLLNSYDLKPQTLTKPTYNPMKPHKAYKFLRLPRSPTPLNAIKPTKPGNPKPYKPETPNPPSPKPETRNPKPEAQQKSKRSRAAQIQCGLRCSRSNGAGGRFSSIWVYLGVFGFRV